MTKGNLIHHYGSKSELALAVLDFKIKEFQSRKVEPVCAQAVPEDAVLEMFAAAGRVFDGNGCKAGCFVGNIALEMSDLDEVFRKKVAAFFDEWADGLAACLERCKSKGYFRKELDARATAESLVALYEGAMMLARSRRDATVFGLLCAESAGPSATHSGNAGGYVLAFHPATRTARIGHFPGPLDEKILEAETLVEQKLPASWRAGAAVEITAKCGSVVEIQVDGITAASTVRARKQKFDGAGVVVINTADDPVEVRVDRFAVLEGS